MSNNNKDGQGWAGTNPALMCTPVNVSPAEELAINLADRALSKMDRFLQLTTGAGVDEWANFGKLGWGKKLQLIGNGAATIATLGGTALARKALENPKVAKVAGAVGNFTLELLTGGNVEQWKNFGEQSFGQKVWMIGNTAVSVATIVVPILAVGRLAPVLKGAGGLAGRLVAGVAKSSFGQKVAAWSVRAAASPAGQAVGTGARWAFKKTGLEAAVQTTKNIGSLTKDLTGRTLDSLAKSEAVQSVRLYGREVSRWFSEKGLRSATDYLKTDLRNPLIKRLVGGVTKPIAKAIAHRKVRAKASKTLGSKVTNWFAETPVGRAIRQSKLTPWHLRDNAVDVAFEGAESLIENRLGTVTKRIADGTVPKGSAKAQELRELLERLRTPVRHVRERVASQELKEKAQQAYGVVTGWFGPGDTAGQD